jgi:hypothetical protein
MKNKRLIGSLGLVFLGSCTPLFFFESTSPIYINGNRNHHLQSDSAIIVLNAHSFGNKLYIVHQIKQGNIVLNPADIRLQTDFQIEESALYFRVGKSKYRQQESMPLKPNQEFALVIKPKEGQSLPNHSIFRMLPSNYLQCGQKKLLIDTLKFRY